MPKGKKNSYNINTSFDKFELAWAAGFFDGEGGTYYYLGKTPLISIGQKFNDECLRRFMYAVHCGVVDETREDVYQYQLNGYEHVQFVVCLIWPYLSEPKRLQATDALSRYRSYWKPRGFRRTTGRERFKHYA